MNKEFIYRLMLTVGIFFLVYQFGFKTYLSNDAFSKQYKNENWAKGKIKPDPDKYDVIVFGEEPEGLASCISAAKLGVRTLLISQNEGLGGKVSKALATNLELDRGEGGEVLNRGILLDLYKKIGEDFTVNKYLDYMKSEIEKNKIDVLYNSKLESPVIEEGIITGLNIINDGISKTVKGKRIIDATTDGELLKLCSAPYFVGSADINLSERFHPVFLNFIVSGVNYKEFDSIYTSQKNEFLSELAKYIPKSLNTRIVDFAVKPLDENLYQVSGLKFYNINTVDSNEKQKAYKNAELEIKEFVKFLKKFSCFKDIKLEKIAEDFNYIESVHFYGEYMLSVNDILENRYFDNTIAVASRPVFGDKFSDNRERVIICNPGVYSIPLGCIIPKNIENLIMVGNKASFSSLACTSTGSFGTSFSIGESAGVFAVYSIYLNVTPREFCNNTNASKLNEFKILLENNSLYLPKTKKKSYENKENFAYSSLKKLNKLALLSFGMNNDYKYSEKAKEKDLAILLLNGAYRLVKEKYSLNMHNLMSKYFNENELQKDRIAEIINVFHSGSQKETDNYRIALEKGYIDKTSDELIQKGHICMDLTYYLADKNLAIFAGKESLEE